MIMIISKVISEHFYNPSSDLGHLTACVSQRCFSVQADRSASTNCMSLCLSAVEEDAGDAK